MICQRRSTSTGTHHDSIGLAKNSGQCVLL